MSESGWTPRAAAPPTFGSGEDVAELSIHPVTPGFGEETPPAVPDADLAGSLGEAELNAAPTPPRPRFGHQRAIARLRRESRFGLAVSLSLVILVTAIFMSLGKAKAGKAPPTVKITQNNAPAQQFAPDLKGVEKDEESPAPSKVEPSPSATAEPPVTAAPSPASEPTTEPAAPPLDKVLSAAAPSEKTRKSGEGDSGTTDREAPPQIAEASPKNEENGLIAQLPESPGTLGTPATTAPQTTIQAPAAPAVFPTPTQPSAPAPAVPDEPQPMPAPAATAVEPAVPTTPEVKASDAAPAPTAGIDPPANPPPAAPAPPSENSAPPAQTPVTPATPATEATQPVSVPQNPPAPSPVEPANSGNTGVVPNTAEAGVKPEPPAPVAASPSAPSSTEPVPIATPRTEPAAQESSTTVKSENEGKEEWVVIPNVRARRGVAERSDPLASAIESAEPLDSGTVDHDHVEPLPHVVQRGENFWTISRKYYRTGRYWKALWAANRQKVAAPDQLYVGTTIRVPPPELLDRTLVEPPTTVRPVTSSGPTVPLRKTSRPILNDDEQQSGTQGSRNADEPQVLTLPLDDSFSRDDAEREEEDNAEPDPRSGRPDERHSRPVYKVRPYDTLRSIARDTLNDPRRADEILELNEDVIDNPRHLIPGQIIELPEDARISRRLR